MSSRDRLFFLSNEEHFFQVKIDEKFTQIWRPQSKQMRPYTQLASRNGGRKGKENLEELNFVT